MMLVDQPATYAAAPGSKETGAVAELQNDLV
jgi:hypothetical protein